jgi:hypothetical protein
MLDNEKAAERRFFHWSTAAFKPQGPGLLDAAAIISA